MSLAEIYCLYFFSDFLNQEYHGMYTFLQWNCCKRCLSLNWFISYLFSLKTPALTIPTYIRIWWEWWYCDKNLWAKIWTWLSWLNFCVVEGSEITLELRELGQLRPAITGYLSSSQVGQYVRFVKGAAMPKEGICCCQHWFICLL